MEDQSAAQILEALAKSDTRSVAARIRDQLPLIEKALAAGTPRREIIEALQRLGIKTTLYNFEKVLARARKREQAEKPAIALPVTAPQPTAQGAPPPRPAPQNPLADLASPARSFNPVPDASKLLKKTNGENE